MPETPPHPGSPTQTWDADAYAANARFVSDLGVPVLSLLDPRPGERILDLGCGDGALTERIAAAGARVSAVDSAPGMVAAARARGLDARMADGHDLDCRETFDAVFSNAALHWMTRPDAVIKGVRRLLRPGGRFVGEFGGSGNVAAAVAACVAALDRRGINGASLSPWYFPTPEDYRKRLETAGFRVDNIALIPRPTRLDSGIERWLETFFQVYLNAVPETDRTGLISEIADTLAPALRDGDGVWKADYVRLRFRAWAPA